MCITLRRAADGGQQPLEPLHLGVEGGIDPQASAEVALVEELEAERGGGDDGEVCASLEVVVLLRRRKQRKSQRLRCGTCNRVLVYDPQLGGRRRGVYMCGRYL